jgi:hypothetical protein
VTEVWNVHFASPILVTLPLHPLGGGDGMSSTSAGGRSGLRT